MKWIGWIICLLGLWMIASPFVLGYWAPMDFTVLLANYLPGVIIAVLGGWTGYRAMQT